MITNINLANFRSYKNNSFEFSPDVNIVVGPNASGKTNLIESILVSSRGSSYRAKDFDIVSFEEDFARIEAHSDNLSRIVMIEKKDPGKVDKTFVINTKKIKRLNLQQTIPIILFEPNHLLLLIGSPELRRNYVDDILEQSTAGFKTLKSQFKRTLQQRNTLLKQKNINENEMFIWNIRFSELSGKIYKYRSSLIDSIGQELTNVYNSISGGKDKITISYQTNCHTNNYESELLKKLEESINIDSDRGFTSYGPHKDDIKFLFNNNLASEVASRGETRTLLLALKIIETTIIETTREQRPILLFDDVFSELDGARRLALTKALKGYQTFITTTDADVVVQHFMDTSNIIPLDK